MLISPAKKRLETLSARLREIKNSQTPMPPAEVIALTEEIKQLQEQLENESQGTSILKD